MAPYIIMYKVLNCIFHGILQCSTLYSTPYKLLYCILYYIVYYTIYSIIFNIILYCYGSPFFQFKYGNTEIRICIPYFATTYKDNLKYQGKIVVLGNNAIRIRLNL